MMRKRRIKLYYNGFTFNNYTPYEIETLLDGIEYTTKDKIINDKFVYYEKVIEHLEDPPETSFYDKNKEIYLNEINMITLMRLSQITGLPMTTILADLNDEREVYESIIVEAKYDMKQKQLKRLEELEELEELEQLQ